MSVAQGRTDLINLRAISYQLSTPEKRSFGVLAIVVVVATCMLLRCLPVCCFVGTAGMQRPVQTSDESSMSLLQIGKCRPPSSMIDTCARSGRVVQALE